MAPVFPSFTHGLAAGIAKRSPWHFSYLLSASRRDNLRGKKIKNIKWLGWEKEGKLPHF